MVPCLQGEDCTPNGVVNLADPQSSERYLPKLDVEGSTPFARSCDVRFDEPNSVYHSDRDHLGSSQIKLADKSPQLFDARVNRQLGGSQQSDALALGSIWHTLCEIGHEEFGDRVVLLPPTHCTPTGGVSTKRETKEFLASLPENAIALTQEWSDTLEKMWANFVANSAALELHESASIRECSVRWTSAAGVKVRCRPDFITEDGRLGDYKSTREAHPRKSFGHSVKEYGYGISAALYEQGCVLAGIADPPMHFVVSSTVFPYETQVLTLPPAYMDFARRRLDELLTEIAERKATGNWLPDGYGQVCELDMPGYGARGVAYVE